MSKKLTTEEFIERAKIIHVNRITNESKYDYSLVEYKNSKTKIKIICKEHGVFEQTPNDHLSGCGCVECSGLKKLTTEEFIEKSNKVHSNIYDYSLVEYFNNNTKVKIICNNHGVFEQIPASHLGGHGCGKCGGTALRNTIEFIEKSIIIYGYTYNYELVEYVNSIIKVKIICKKHGVFEQSPDKHLAGHQCPFCGFEESSLKRANTSEYFIEKSAFGCVCNHLAYNHKTDIPKQHPSILTNLSAKPLSLLLRSK